MQRVITWEQILEILTQTRKDFNKLLKHFSEDTITEGFKIYRLETELAKELFNVKADEVRIELVQVKKVGTPHLHKFAEAGFLFLGESLGFEDSNGSVLLGEWNKDGCSVLDKYIIKDGLVMKVPPLLVHGFEAKNPIWFLGVHTPLIHENNDLEVVNYMVSHGDPKEYVLRS